MLDIFNCGQGDSIRLASKGCIWHAKNPLYIDLGPASYTRAVAENEIDLLITHSHNDHISGMSIPKRVRIRTLYIPAYYLEIRKIVSHLTGRGLHLPGVQKGNIKILYEGARCDCSHIEILNPPLNPYDIFGVDLENASGVDEYLERFGTSVDGIINDQADLGDVSLPDGYEPEKFIRVAVHLIARQDKGDTIKAINRFIEYDANKISVVFLYKNNNHNGNEETFLLTGDADKSVFNRLIKAKKKTLKADVLKVPHHGSKNNLNLRIVRHISPKIAVISHNNGKFGRAKDPHPNKEIVDILRKCGVPAYYTNDVIKNNNTVCASHSGKISGASVTII
jgi:hypothetical protein